jgi:hypothetical protein
VKLQLPDFFFGPLDPLASKKFLLKEYCVQNMLWKTLKTFHAGHALFFSPPRGHTAREVGDTTPALCALDALAFATGWALNASLFERVQEEVSALHATCVIGQTVKIQMLRDLGLWCAEE